MRRHIEPVRCDALFYDRRAARATKDDARGVGARAAVCVVVTVRQLISTLRAASAPVDAANARARAELDANPRAARVRSDDDARRRRSRGAEGDD